MEKITEKRLTDYEEKPSGSYTEMKVAEQKTREKAEEDKIRMLFFDYLKFYDENYPKSTIGYKYLEPKIKLEIKEETFKKDLDKFSEQELLDTRHILKYSRNEHKGAGMDEYYSYLHAMALVNRGIPALSHQEELDKLKDQEQETKKRRKELEALIEKEREKFNAKRLQPVAIEKKEEPKLNAVKIEANEFTCPFCQKPCGNKGGLAVHVRTHNK